MHSLNAMKPKKKKILVVDQEADIRGFLQTVLTNRHFEVNLAPDVQEAISQFDKKKPDLLILDALLSQQGMQTLLSHTKDTPVLFISGIPLKVLFFRRKLQIGIDLFVSGSQVPFLEKPLQEDELIEQIHRLIKNK